MLPKTLAFVDIETSGTSIRFDRIIEIGIVRVEDNKIVQEYQTLLNPESHIDPFIENLTGISPVQLENAPTFNHVKDEILELLKDSVFVAHNVRFDYGFLKNEFRRFDQTFRMKHFCSVKLARLLYPGYKNYNLDSLIERYNIPCENRHRALPDAKAIWYFLDHAQKDLPAQKIDESIHIALKRPSIPLYISQQDLENLPEEPGVYIFYGDQKTPLYIGKSINLKDRVLSHFSGDHLTTLDMKISQQIKSIKTIPTPGELSALLLESTLIKKHQPLFNRKLRNAYKMIALEQTTTEDGYKTVTVQTLTEIKIDKLRDTVGIYKSLKHMKRYLQSLAENYSLCPRLLGLEKGKGFCFSYHLERCKGACNNEEAVLKYNLRFDEAFFSKRIKPWPFKGPIAIRESYERDETIVIDKWCIVGSLKEGSTLEELENTYSFDHDTYKILLQYIFTSKNEYTIHLVSHESSVQPRIA